MNITELSRLDVNDEEGNNKHTIYLSKDDSGVLVVQAKTDYVTEREMHEAAKAVDKAVATAIVSGYCVIALGHNLDLKIINLGNKNERLKEISKLLESEER